MKLYCMETSLNELIKKWQNGKDKEKDRLDHFKFTLESFAPSLSNSNLPQSNIYKSTNFNESQQTDENS